MKILGSKGVFIIQGQKEMRSSENIIIAGRAQLYTKIKNIMELLGKGVKEPLFYGINLQKPPNC